MSEDEYPEDDSVEPVTEELAQDVIGEESVLLTYLFASPSLFSKAAPILKPEYFTGVHADAVRFALAEYHREHKVPNRLIMSAKTKFLPELVQDQDDEQVVRIISESVESFCRMKAADLFLINAVEKIGKDRSNATMTALREEMERVTRISMARDLGSEFHEDFEAKMASAKANTNISTGSEMLDMVLGGGLIRPSFSIISAATGDGKSIYLANRAVDHIRRHPGEDVVYYTLENSEELTYQRLAAMMAELDIKTVLDNVDKVREYVYRNGSKEGRLFIKRFPFRGTTLSDIRGHYYDLRAHRNANIRWLGIDYMDLMSPTNDVKIENIHVRDEEITSEMYNFIHQEKLIGWTAAQQTKGADEETEAKKGKVSGGVKKTFACDNLFINKRSDDDTMLQRIWSHCKKARSSAGINSAIPISWNSKTQRMKDYPSEPEKAAWWDEFKRVNPRLFGFYPKNRVEADPIAAELGVSAPVPSRIEDLNERAKQVKDNLINRLRSPTRTG